MVLAYAEKSRRATDVRVGTELGPAFSVPLIDGIVESVNLGIRSSDVTILDRRQFMEQSVAGLALLGLSRTAFSAPAGPILLSANGCGRATGYAEANKIVTSGGKTHAAWLDSEADGFRVRIRTLDHTSNAWSETITIDEAFDNHGGPALTIDSEGYLHIAYYPHHHPMRYRRSVRPNDASEWTPAVEIGTRATYPTLVCGPDDTLYLTHRVSSKEEPWWVDLYTKTKGAADWSEPTRILQADEGGYAHFMETLAWGPSGKTLHLATRLYGGDPPRGHTVGYMKSDDGGATWTKRDGSPITLPATSRTIDIAEQARDEEGVGFRAGSMAIDSENRPAILCASYDKLPLESWLVTLDKDNVWQRKNLRPLLPAAYADWGVSTPGGVTYTENGTLYVVLQMARPEGVKDTTIWGHPSCEVVLFESRDRGETFTSRVLTTPDPSRPRWLPSLERPTGHNRVIDVPGLIYTDGGRGENNRQILSNNVYWQSLQRRFELVGTTEHPPSNGD